MFYTCVRKFDITVTIANILGSERSLKIDMLQRCGLWTSCSKYALKNSCLSIEERESCRFSGSGTIRPEQLKVVT